ncbi:MAG: ABC transporter permease [Armatimonadota bacterium]|nr:ABC transporter permease [Armatimonadota bacterium]MDR7493793.1 ABC transporter permease [Armatimonadota bacterium]MDR7499046.1 ABC transporter permease [Armatimonadota bacterium]MDR7546185.1 ABC transporter permease [Armatimonadota bacterium]MDR7559581.1 ABC transporter permease [Armatimonadota bacterium]
MRNGRAGRVARRRLWRRLTLSARVGFAVVAVICSAAAAPALITPADPEQVDILSRLAPPSERHPLGTDHIGRDLLSRLVYGARVSLLVAAASVGGAAAVGVAVGLLAGYYGRWVDGAAMRLVDTFLAFPAILLALALVAALGAGVTSVIVALVLVFWTQYARVVRAVTLAEKEKAYVEAARAIGAGDLRILLRHILPSVVSPVVILATLGMGTAVVAESTLSFLGMGVQPPAPSWGWTLAFGTRYLRDAPHIATFSGLAIMATVLGFNLVGDGIRDLLDPKFRPQ